jgi:hypothetical protein
MTYSGLTPEDLARRVGRSGMRIRKLLRQLYPNLAPGSGSRWELTDEQVGAVLSYYAGSTPTLEGGNGSASIGTGAPVVVRGDVPTDWFWEGHVHDVMVAYLRREGWTITAESNMAIRAQGDDIAALKDGRRLVVEVKGYPSVGYRDPRRAGELKRTNPTLQAKHWFADALLKLVRIRGKRPDVSAAMPFPDSPRYRSLIEETREPLRQLGVGLFVVMPDGRVDEVLPPLRSEV